MRWRKEHLPYPEHKGDVEFGPSDIGGNVWEWTNTCFLRMTLEPTGAARVTNTNCGVRVVQGAHRT